MITIKLKQDQISPGQILQGECSWQTNSDKDFQNATLTLGWRTEGRGNVDQEKFSQKIKLASLVPVPFECAIPPKAPLSYDGELIRIIWEIEVSFDKGLFAGKEQAKEMIRVVGSLTTK